MLQEKKGVECNKQSVAKKLKGDDDLEKEPS